jgi:DNA primase
MVQHKAQSFLEYKLQLAIIKYNVQTIEGKADAVKELLPDLARIKSQVEKDQYIKLIAKVLEIPEGAIYADLGRQSISGQMDILNNGKHTKNTGLLGKGPGLIPKKDAVTIARRNLCRLMIEDRSGFDLVEKNLGLEIFEDTVFAEILNLVSEIYPEFDWLPATLVARADDSDLKKTVTELLMADIPCENKDVMVRDCVRMIKLYQLKNRIDQIQTELTAKGREQVNGDVRLLLQEFSKLQQQVQDLKK